jgi:translation initiation factor 2 subunit 1
MPLKSEFPEEGDLVVGTVKNVKNFGAFITLDEFDRKEGFIHISEVSSGWVKYIRDFVREGQKVVCKVLNVDPSKGHVDLSLKRVNDHLKRQKIQEWKNEQKAEKLFELVANKIGKEIQTCYEEFGDELIDKYGYLYGAFEEAAISIENLKDDGFKGDWLDPFAEVAIDNIVPPFVSIQGVLDISLPAADGITKISQALTAVEKEEDDFSVVITYLGAPRYRMVVKAPDYKIAEDEMKTAVDEVTENITKMKGTCQFNRKD